MKTTKMKFLKAFLNKWQKMGVSVAPAAACDNCCQWALWRFRQDDGFIPQDVPKGHTVVYVGEEYKRFVIRITLLDHPLFKALLDKAREEYDFITASKLRIPCDEEVFLSVVRCATSPHNQRIFSSWKEHSTKLFTKYHS